MMIFKPEYNAKVLDENIKTSLCELWLKHLTQQIVKEIEEERKKDSEEA